MKEQKVEILGKWQIYGYLFENGLEVLLLEEKATPLISFHTWFRVGSSYEPQGKTGLAHLFEHLMFESTHNHPSGEFDRILESYGAESNAATWLDWTYYHETFPPEALGVVLEFEPDRMVNLILDEQVVEREKKVVMNERSYRVEDNIEGFMDELLFKESFKAHPYRNPTIGWMEDIASLSLDDCRQFYRRFYSPSNAVIVVAGNFDRRDMLRLLRDCYGSIPPEAVDIPEIASEPPSVVEKRITVYKQISSPRVLIGYRSPAFTSSHNAHLSVLNIILCGGASGRLVRKFVYDEEVASDVYGWVGTFKYPSLYEIQIDLKEGADHNSVIEKVDEEMEKIFAGQIDEVELEKARNRILLSLYNGLSSTGGKAGSLGFYEVVAGSCDFLNKRLEILHKTGLSDIVDVARRYLGQESRTIIVALPSGK